MIIISPIIIFGLQLHQRQIQPTNAKEKQLALPAPDEQDDVPVLKYADDPNVYKLVQRASQHDDRTRLQNNFLDVYHWAL